MGASSKFKNTLPTTPEFLMQKLNELNIPYERFEHPPLFTVNDAKEHQDQMHGMHVKNLFLRDKKKKNFLLVAEQDTEINLKYLHEKIESDRLSFGSPDRLWQFLGVRPGAVSPLALVNDKSNEVSLVFEDKLQADHSIYFHPIVNDVTLGIKLTQLASFFVFTGHEPKFVKL